MTPYIFSTVPIWALALALWFICIGVLHLGRQRFEGLSYNIAFSSEIGDFFLITIILIAASLSPTKTVISVWASGSALIVGCIFGYVADVIHLKQIAPRKAQIVDRYYNFIVVPTLTSLLIESFMIIFKSGGVSEVISAWVALCVWIYCLVYDARNGRLDQRKWLYKKRYIKMF